MKKEQVEQVMDTHWSMTLTTDQKELQRVLVEVIKQDFSNVKLSTKEIRSLEIVLDRTKVYFQTKWRKTR